MSCENSVPLIIALLAVAFIVMLVICYDCGNSVAIIERLDEPIGRRADCPSGYVLSGNTCTSDGISKSQTCNGSDKKIPKGKCQRVDLVTCPDGFITKTSYCFNPSTNEQRPFTAANCPAGAVQNGPFCYSEYEGKCDPYFKNSHSDNNACVHEMDSILPRCTMNEILKDGHCYTKTVDAFTNANKIEAQALASLYN